MKKLTTVLLALVLLMAFAVPAMAEETATSGQCGDNMFWSLDETTGTLTISGTGDMYTVVDGLEWEDEILWRPEWWNNDNIKHIVIEEGVERLTNFAFRHNFYVESIQLPSTLKELPDLGVFASREVIAQLIIPEGITSITGWPFGSPGNSMMHIKELYLPSTLTKMDLMSLALACVQTDDDGNLSFDELTVHYAGTQEQWEAIERVKSDFFVEQGLDSFYENFADYFPSFEAAVVFEPKQDEDITVDNGNASIPDSKVEITEGEDVVIDVTGTEEEVTGAVIGAETVDKIADAETSVEIKLPDATVSFDAAAMGIIAGAAADSAITIVAKETKQENLTTEQKAALAELNVSTVISLEVLAGDTKISDFGGGKATITVPFVLPEGKDAASYYVAYIADDGTITAMPTTYAEGMLTFTTTHFSDYVVLEKTTTQPPATEPPVSDNPQTGDNSHLMLWVMLLTVSAAALVVCTTKRKAF